MARFFLAKDAANLRDSFWTKSDQEAPQLLSQKISTSLDACEEKNKSDGILLLQWSTEIIVYNLYGLVLRKNIQYVAFIHNMCFSNVYWPVEKLLV